jgi:phosphatidylserine/phosphatidylglycerophosphate/cardiolipin synthase-like enzyme
MQLDGPVVLSLDIVFATDWFLETTSSFATYVLTRPT